MLGNKAKNKTASYFGSIPSVKSSKKHINIVFFCKSNDFPLIKTKLQKKNGCTKNMKIIHTLDTTINQ